MEPDKVKATWNEITKQIKLAEEGVKSLDSAQQEMLAKFTSAAKNNIDAYKEVLNAAREADKEGGTFADKMKALGKEVDLTSKAMEPIVKYLEVANDRGQDFYKSIKDLKVEFTEVSEQAGKTAEFLDQMAKSLKGIGAGAISGIFTGGKDAMKSFQKGFSDLSKIESGEMGMGAGLAGGMTGILGGLEAIRELTEPFRKGWADVNKQVLDVNSQVGKLGEFTDNITESAGELSNKYNMSLDTIMKLDVSLAKIGASHDDINSSLDDMLARYEKMPSLTPEKQVDMMAQYMHRFGMSSTQANDALGNLFTNAQKVAKEMGLTNVSAGEFMERAQSLEISSRSMGYNFGDATARLEIMVKLLREAGQTNVDMEGAAKATAAIMSVGAGNLGMQAYMMEQYGGRKGATPQGAIGAFALNEGGGREQAQIGLTMDMMAKAGYVKGEDTKTQKGREELAGQITLAFKGMGMTLDPQQVQALTGAMKAGPEHFQQEMLKQTEEASKLRDKQTDDNKNMGGNVKNLVSATTTMEQSIVGWLGKIAGLLVEIANHFTIGGGTLEEREARGVSSTKRIMGDVIAKRGSLTGSSFASEKRQEEEYLASSADELENMKKVISAEIPASAGKDAQMLKAYEVQVYIKARESYRKKFPQSQSG